MTALERQIISTLFYIECDLRTAAARIAPVRPDGIEATLTAAADTVRRAIKMVEGGKS